MLTPISLFDTMSNIFYLSISNNQLTFLPRSHEGAVWSVSWAHPKYGNILASASYDGKVFIWRETNSQWTRIYDFALHTASVNTLSWAPHESGCLLACASSDGNVSVLEFKDNSMDHKIFQAHGIGVNSVSWAPSTSAGSLVSTAGGQSAGGQRRFVTGGSDNLVKFWAWDPATQSYKQEGEPLVGHGDWVRDVAWSPSVLQRSYVASASQDKTVRIWTSDPSNPTVWYVNVPSGPSRHYDLLSNTNLNCYRSSKILPFETVVWRVSWSLSGNVLAVSAGDNKVSLWKENLRGEWECVKNIEE